MVKTMFRSLLVIVIFLLFQASAVQAVELLPSQPNIRVGLAEGLTSVGAKVSYPSGGYGYQVYFYDTDKTKFVEIKAYSSEMWNFNLVSGKIEIKKNDILQGKSNGPVYVRENGHNTQNRISITIGGWTKVYRGFLKMVINNQKIVAINELPIEEYLYGVVTNEMPSSWPGEALKAQALAARTYAYNKVVDNPGALYHVYPTTSSQVYNGAGTEKESGVNAVESTKGKLIIYNNAPIDAYFFSTSGGWTENSEDVWASALGYIKEREDPYGSMSPHNSWTMTLTMDQLTERINGWKYRGHIVDIGNVLRLDILETTRPVNGRVKVLKATGTKGTETFYNADNVRLALTSGGDFKSSLFTMNYSGFKWEDYPKTYSAGDPVSVINGSGQVSPINLNGLSVLSASGVSNLSNYTVAGKMQVPASYTFHGKGWGHGLGMPQYGARGMAETTNPVTSHKYTGEEIIQYYYKNTTITQKWNGTFSY